MTNQEIRAAIKARHEAGLTAFNVPYEEWERRYSGAPEYWIDMGELNPGVWATKHMMIYFGPDGWPDEAPARPGQGERPAA
jgi:hypothetical protein